MLRNNSCLRNCCVRVVMTLWSCSPSGASGIIRQQPQTHGHFHIPPAPPSPTSSKVCPSAIIMWPSRGTRIGFMVSMLMIHVKHSEKCWAMRLILTRLQSRHTAITLSPWALDLNNELAKWSFTSVENSFGCFGVSALTTYWDCGFIPLTTAGHFFALFFYTPLREIIHYIYFHQTTVKTTLSAVPQHNRIHTEFTSTHFQSGMVGVGRDVCQSAGPLLSSSSPLLITVLLFFPSYSSLQNLSFLSVLIL